MIRRQPRCTLLPYTRLFRSAADMPSLVSIAEDSPREIRNALDSGATGIVVPHVTTAEQATAIVKAAHFGVGGRRSEEHTSALQSHLNLVFRLLLEKKEHTSDLQSQFALGFSQGMIFKNGRPIDIRVIYTGIFPVQNTAHV